MVAQESGGSFLSLAGPESAVREVVTRIMVKPDVQNLMGGSYALAPSRCVTLF